MKIFDKKNLLRYAIMNMLVLYLVFLLFDLYPIANWHRGIQNGLMLLLFITAFWQHAYVHTEQVFNMTIESYYPYWEMISRYIDIVLWLAAMFVLLSALFYSVGRLHLNIFAPIYSIYFLSLIVGIFLRVKMRKELSK